MQVRVALLRKKGEKLSADQVSAGPWLQGFIDVIPEPERRMSRNSALVAVLMPEGKSFDPLAELFSVRLRRMGSKGLVLVGIEEYWDRKQGIEYPQAWWCVPVTLDSTEAGIANHPGR